MRIQPGPAGREGDRRGVGGDKTSPQNFARRSRAGSAACPRVPVREEGVVGSLPVTAPWGSRAACSAPPVLPLSPAVPHVWLLRGSRPPPPGKDLAA